MLFLVEILFFFGLFLFFIAMYLGALLSGKPQVEGSVEAGLLVGFFFLILASLCIYLLDKADVIFDFLLRFFSRMFSTEK